MADIVNLQQSEYDTAMEKLAALHDEALTGISKIATEIRELSEISGGFYIDKISAKIASLMDTLNSGILAPTEMNFAASKTCMDDFATIISNVDTACKI